MTKFYKKNNSFNVVLNENSLDRLNDILLNDNAKNTSMVTIDTSYEIINENSTQTNELENDKSENKDLGLQYKAEKNIEFAIEVYKQFLKKITNEVLYETPITDNDSDPELKKTSPRRIETISESIKKFVEINEKLIDVKLKGETKLKMTKETTENDDKIVSKYVMTTEQLLNTTIIK